MKTFLPLFLFWSLQTLAAECPSVWVFKAYTSCKYMPDRSQTPNVNFSEGHAILSPWVGGGEDVGKLCKKLVDSQAHPTAGIETELTSVPPKHSESRVNALAGMRTEYNYLCGYKIITKAYPTKQQQAPTCPTESDWSYQVGGSKQDLPGVGHCLSCQDFADEPPNAMVDCLKESTEILKSQAIPVREADFTAVADSMAALLELEQSHIPISNLKSTAQIKEFIEAMTWVEQQARAMHPGQ
jgi:hypothetical protein